MTVLIGVVRRLSAACGVIAAICLAAASLVVCQMVFVRYVLGASTVWQTEFVLYAVVAATLMGSPYVLAVGGHVKVDLLAPRLRPRPRAALELAGSGIGLTFCIVLAWSGWRYFHEAWVQGWVTESVWAPPLWAVLLPLPLGIGILVLEYLVQILVLVTGRAAPPVQDIAE